MKLLFKEIKQWTKLAFVLLCLCFGVVGYFFYEGNVAMILAQMGVAVIYAGAFMWNRSRGYATVTKDTIKLNEIFSNKKMAIEDIVEVKFFAGDIILKAKENEELVLCPEILNEEHKKWLQNWAKDQMEQLKTR